jgi:hypothetical protein
MAEVNNITLLNILVLCWKDSNATYFPNGAVKQISCRHEREECIYSVNTRGRATRLPNTSIVPGPPVTSPVSVPLSDWQTEQGYVTAGQAINNASPAPFPPSANVHLCYKIKDLTTGITLYADIADYNSKIPLCNPVPYSS